MHVLDHSDTSDTIMRLAAPHARGSGPVADNYRKRLKLWLREIMRQHGWTAERWAREAGIAGTTITRFLNSDDPNRTPHTSTLVKLARAAGVPAMHEAQQQIYIGVIRKHQLLEEARRVAPQPLDIFSMPTVDHIPAPVRYADCTLVEMDNGRMVICRPAKVPEIDPGKHVVVLRDLDSIAEYVVAPPLLVPTDTSKKFPGVVPLPCADPTKCQILGTLAALFIDMEG